MFKIITYVFQVKKGIEKPDEFVTDVSFSLLQGFFVASFIILVLITVLLGFLGVHFDSSFLKIFATLFLIVLGIDVVVYIKVKKVFSHLSKKVVDYGKKTYQKQQSRIIDVE